MSKSLSSFIEERLAWELSPSELNMAGFAEELADSLENNGYCTESYHDYERALTCPINKRGEKDCLMSSCPSNIFCRLLRKEGYIK